MGAECSQRDDINGSDASTASPRWIGPNHARDCLVALCAPPKDRSIKDTECEFPPQGDALDGLDPPTFESPRQQSHYSTQDWSERTISDEKDTEVLFSQSGEFIQQGMSAEARDCMIAFCAPPEKEVKRLSKVGEVQAPVPVEDPAPSLPTLIARQQSFEVDSQQHAKASSFDYDNAYSGQWQDGVRNGLGRQSYPSGCSYVGEWSGNIKSGRGRFIDAAGDTYTGEWRDGAGHGRGTYYSGQCTYIGEFCCGLQHGHGIEEWRDGLRFDGQFRQGRKDGYGIYCWGDDSRYFGTFEAGAISGKGMYIGCDGRRFRGSWEDSLMHGMGQYFWPTGVEFSGQYLFSQKEGFGIHSLPDGSRHEGFWLRGRRHGHGQLCSIDGTTTSGRWENNQLEEQVKAQFSH